MSTLKRLPVDLSHFKTMIEDNYLYVDKTEIIYQLFSRRRLYFLSRPRRFGKSLLISTLKELFSGNKKLFKDTWIGQQKDYAWKQHPVLHFDFSILSHETSQEFKNDLIWSLEQMAKNHGISLAKVPTLSTKFSTLIERLSTKHKVVILIDEYDAPLLHNLDNIPVAKALQKVMRTFFSVIKGADARGHIHAVFITGVTKFAKTSLFSGINNLVDITLSPDACTLCGYTKDELTSYFKEYAQAFAKANSMSQQKVFDIVQDWYNGYRFSKDPTKVYNPYSVTHFFDQNDLKNYWLETGTPSFLIELLKGQAGELENIENTELNSSYFGSFEIGSLPIIPILVQAGYLTITDYNPERQTFKLNYPNKEVGESFKSYLLASLSHTNARSVEMAIAHFRYALDTNNMELFVATLKNLLANVPYQIYRVNEAFFHSLFQLLVDLLGIEGQSEVSSASGSIDTVLQTHNSIFIFEFKFKKSDKKALKQIIEKRYYEKYLRLKKPIILVGLSFNIKNKQLALDWTSKDMPIKKA
jgi:hypothetical protein